MKHRALLSYKEAKAKRQKKIKSKRYELYSIDLSDSVADETFPVTVLINDAMYLQCIRTQTLDIMLVKHSHFIRNTLNYHI